MVEAINTWLKNGSNYAEGVSLYAEFGSDLFLKVVLKKGDTPANRQKLDAALATLSDSAEPVAAHIHAPADPPAAATAPQEIIEPAADKLAAETPALLRVIEDRKRSIGAVQSLHPQLTILPEGESLLNLAINLVNLGKQNAVLWEKYNYLSEGGVEHAPHQPAPPPPVMVDLHLLQKREAIRKSLNKAENRIKGAEKPHPNTLQLIEDRP